LEFRLRHGRKSLFDYDDVGVRLSRDDLKRGVIR
jgi:hypothetical protein